MYRPDLRSVKDTVPEEPEGIQHFGLALIVDQNRVIHIVSSLHALSLKLLFLYDSSCHNPKKVISLYLKKTGIKPQGVL